MTFTGASVWENLMYFGRLKGVGRGAVRFGWVVFKHAEGIDKKRGTLGQY